MSPGSVPVCEYRTFLATGEPLDCFAKNRATGLSLRDAEWVAYLGQPFVPCTSPVGTPRRTYL